MDAEGPVRQRAAAKDQDRVWSAMMALAQDGNSQAYVELLAEITPFIRALVRPRLRDRETVEDVVQETLLTLHRVRATYDPSRSFSAWIAVIAARRAIDALRRRGRTGRHEISDEHAYETFADPAANNQEAGLAGDVIAALLAELPPKQRQALELVKVKEMSLSEAASLSGQSPGALKVNVHRALKSLRARLQGGEA